MPIASSHDYLPQLYKINYCCQSHPHSDNCEHTKLSAHTPTDYQSYRIMEFIWKRGKSPARSKSKSRDTSPAPPLPRNTSSEVNLSSSYQQPQLSSAWLLSSKKSSSSLSSKSLSDESQRSISTPAVPVVTTAQPPHSPLLTLPQIPHISDMSSENWVEELTGAVSLHSSLLAPSTDSSSRLSLESGESHPDSFLHPPPSPLFEPPVRSSTPPLRRRSPSPLPSPIITTRPILPEQPGQKESSCYIVNDNFRSPPPFSAAVQHQRLMEALSVAFSESDDESIRTVAPQRSPKRAASPTLADDNSHLLHKRSASAHSNRNSLHDPLRSPAIIYNKRNSSGINLASLIDREKLGSPVKSPVKTPIAQFHTPLEDTSVEEQINRSRSSLRNSFPVFKHEPPKIVTDSAEEAPSTSTVATDTVTDTSAVAPLPIPPRSPRSSNAHAAFVLAPINVGRNTLLTTPHQQPADPNAPLLQHLGPSSEVPVPSQPASTKYSSNLLLSSDGPYCATPVLPSELADLLHASLVDDLTPPRKAPKAPLLIDVRNLALFQQTHVKGSLNVNLPTLLIKRYRRGAIGNFSLESFITTPEGRMIYNSRQEEEVADNGLEEEVIIVYDECMDENVRDTPAWTLIAVLERAVNTPQPSDTEPRSKTRVHWLGGGFDSFREFVQKDSTGIYRSLVIEGSPPNGMGWEDIPPTPTGSTLLQMPHTSVPSVKDAGTSEKDSKDSGLNRRSSLFSLDTSRRKAGSAGPGIVARPGAGAGAGGATVPTGTGSISAVPPRRGLAADNGHFQSPTSASTTSQSSLSRSSTVSNDASASTNTPVSPNPEDANAILTKSPNPLPGAPPPDTPGTPNSGDETFTISEVIPGFLFLGPEITTEAQMEALKARSIQRILNMAEECDDNVPGLKEEFVYRKISARDTVDMKGVEGCLRDAVGFINDSKRHHVPIYVHCRAGKSRSVTAVLAYMIQSERWTLKRAYRHVTRARPGICPNIGFVAELMRIEFGVHGVVSSIGGEWSSNQHASTAASTPIAIRDGIKPSEDGETPGWVMDREVEKLGREWGEGIVEPPSPEARFRRGRALTRSQSVPSAFSIGDGNNNRTAAAPFVKDGQEAREGFIAVQGGRFSVDGI